jgi:hypothetical protein
MKTWPRRGAIHVPLFRSFRVCCAGSNAVEAARRIGVGVGAAALVDFTHIGLAVTGGEYFPADREGCMRPRRSAERRGREKGERRSRALPFV